MTGSTIATSGKVEQILGDLRKLPLLPATAQQAMSLANESNASLPEFSRLIERDVTLASSILKLANSPIFTWGRTIESVDQAVLRLGLRECQNLLMAISMRNLFVQADPVSKAHCAVLWQHCFLTACFARRLNKELCFDYQGEEFLAALLHDLGRILLAVTMPHEFNAADPMNFREGADLLAGERQVLDTDHCQVGSLYAQQNRLPFSAIAAIQYHHNLEEAKDHRGILGLVSTADHLANYVHTGEAPEAYDLELNPGFQYLGRGWPDEKVQGFKKVMPGLITDTVRLAGEQANPSKSTTAPKAPMAKTRGAQQTESKKSFWGNVRGWLGD